MKNKMKFILSAVIILCISLGGYAYAGVTASDSKIKFTIPFGKKYDYNNILVKQVLDVKTIMLEDGQQVRLIGVDDFKKEGKDASRYLRDLVEGKTVRLEFGQHKYDRGGFLLAYVYLGDGRNLNSLLIKEGYALAKTELDNVRFKELFAQSQIEAKKDKRGLWAQ